MSELTRRTLLSAAAGAAGLGSLGIWNRVALARPDAVSVTDFRSAGDPDDSAAFRRALATGRPVHVPAGGGSAPDGSFLIDDVAPLPGSVLFGDGIGRTVVRPRRTPGRSQRAAFHCDSGAANVRIAGIRISGMTIEGWVREQGFAEHQHLIHLNGVQDVLIEAVEFKGFQGDGLYLGSGRKAGTERHNVGVTVRGCAFDGVNNDNRNAISVIDGEGILIEDCVFRNCTRANMPGAIDIEPDANRFATVRRITISACRFENIGGNLAAVAMHIPPAVAAIPTQIAIIGNTFSRYKGTGHEIYLNAGRELVAADPDMAITIANNRGSEGNGVYSLYAVKGVSISGNTWHDYRRGSHVGYTESRLTARNVSIRDTFTLCGSVSGVGLHVFTASGLKLDGTQFVDCGHGGTHSYAICFSSGASGGVSLQNLRIASPGGRTRVAVIRDPGHRLSPSTNRQGANDFGGLPAVDITAPA